MIVKNRLLNFTDKIIYQNEDYFAFSLDSVLLANFVTIKLSDKKLVDLCTGNAPIPMPFISVILSKKTGYQNRFSNNRHLFCQQKSGFFGF